MQTTEGYPFLMLLELIHKIGYELCRGQIEVCIDRQNLLKKSRYDKIRK